MSNISYVIYALHIPKEYFRYLDIWFNLKWSWAKSAIADNQCCDRKWAKICYKKAMIYSRGLFYGLCSLWTPQRVRICDTIVYADRNWVQWCAQLNNSVTNFTGPNMAWDTLTTTYWILLHYMEAASAKKINGEVGKVAVSLGVPQLNGPWWRRRAPTPVRSPPCHKSWCGG